jgi:hypothetical protein
VARRPHQPAVGRLIQALQFWAPAPRHGRGPRVPAALLGRGGVGNRRGASGGRLADRCEATRLIPTFHPRGALGVSSRASAAEKPGASHFVTLPPTSAASGRLPPRNPRPSRASGAHRGAPGPTSSPRMSWYAPHLRTRLCLRQHERLRKCARSLALLARLIRSAGPSVPPFASPGAVVAAAAAADPAVFVEEAGAGGAVGAVDSSGMRILVRRTRSWRSPPSCTRVRARWCTR